VRKLRWDTEPAKTTSKHPYRDSAFVYAGLAGLVVVIAAATGGSVVKAVVAGVVVFTAATAYSWWRVRERLRRQEGGEK
jgi:Flp pilus assembly protein TadB